MTVAGTLALYGAVLSLMMGNLDSSPAPLRYGDDDIAIWIGFGPDEENKHITSYFRTGFEVPEDWLDSSLRMSPRCDDGAIIYLNGKEVMRYNLHGRKVQNSQSALRIISGSSNLGKRDHGQTNRLLN